MLYAVDGAQCFRLPPYIVVTELSAINYIKLDGGSGDGITMRARAN